MSKILTSNFNMDLLPSVQADTHPLRETQTSAFAPFHTSNHSMDFASTQIDINSLFDTPPAGHMPFHSSTHSLDFLNAQMDTHHLLETASSYSNYSRSNVDLTRRQPESHLFEPRASGSTNPYTPSHSTSAIDLLTSSANDHPLLDARPLAYTHATVRRAFIVWLKCGQKNQFRDVCNYFHHLEAMEDQLSPEARAASRHHEFSLFMGPPPTSPYQQRIFPDLYTSSTYDHSHTYVQNFQYTPESVKAENIKTINPTKEVTSQDIFDASQVFKTPVEVVEKGLKIMQASDAFKPKLDKVQDINGNKVNQDGTNGTTEQDILETSRMIKKYCKDQEVPLKNFLENFKEYATRCQLNSTVINVAFYIKRRMIKSELTLAVLVHRTKTNRAQTLTPNSQPKTDLTAQTKLLTTFSKLQSDIKTVDSGPESIMTICYDDMTMTLNPCGDDLIKFDDKDDDNAMNTITILRREEDLKGSVAFSNSQNILKTDSQSREI